MLRQFEQRNKEKQRQEEEAKCEDVRRKKQEAKDEYDRYMTQHCSSEDPVDIERVDTEARRIILEKFNVGVQIDDEFTRDQCDELLEVECSSSKT